MNIIITIWQLFLFSLLLLISPFFLGQSNDNVSFTSIDKYAQKAPVTVCTDVKTLANYLSEPASNDFERARSFYVWLTTNISYDMQAYKNGRRRINQTNEDILRRKRAVCFGYSKFFKALCDEVGLPCEVISGYSKGSLTSTPNLEQSDHAWNAVKLEGKWYLLDATWGAGVVYRESEFVHQFSEEYFLTSPEKLIVNHLPADPMWQLLPCAVTTDDFKESATYLMNLVADKSSNCENYADSLAKFEQLGYHQKMLTTAIHTYQFNPTEANAKELGHAYMDYESYLDEKAVKLQQTNEIDELLAVQLEMIQTSEQAKQYIELFDRQKENLAYTYMNLAATLSRKLTNFEAAKNYYQMVIIYEEILPYFEKAKNMLNSLPRNLQIENALQQCAVNIMAVKNNLGIYRQELKLNDK
ncbi:MAG: transglutaminase domain-containing protein [Chitinophagales bacterium]